MNSSDGVNPAVREAPAPRKHHLTITKERIGELDAFLEEQGVKSLEELRQRVASNKDAFRDTAPVVVGPSSGSDPLDWITSDTEIVWLVSKYGSICLRPQHSDWMPPMKAVYANAVDYAVWNSCPFFSNTGDKIFDLGKNVQNSKWNHYRITRQQCASLYMDDRFPVPSRSVIDPVDFGGWNHDANVPNGPRTDLPGPDPLRETVRKLLQHGGERTYLCADYADQAAVSVNPNPYTKNTLDGMQLKYPDVDDLARKMREAAT